MPVALCTVLYVTVRVRALAFMLLSAPRRLPSASTRVTQNLMFGSSSAAQAASTAGRPG